MASTTFHKVSPCSNSHRVPGLFSACRALRAPPLSLQVLCLLSQELHCLFIKKPQLEIEELSPAFSPRADSLSYISSFLSCCLGCFVASSFCYCWELFTQPALPVMKGLSKSDTDGRDCPSQPSHLSLSLTAKALCRGRDQGMSLSLPCHSNRQIGLRAPWLKIWRGDRESKPGNQRHDSASQTI